MYHIEFLFLANKNCTSTDPKQQSKEPQSVSEWKRFLDTQLLTEYVLDCIKFLFHRFD